MANIHADEKKMLHVLIQDKNIGRQMRFSMVTVSSCLGEAYVVFWQGPAAPIQHGGNGGTGKLGYRSILSPRIVGSI